MTIYDVKGIHLEKFPDSHFFDTRTMKFFRQTLKSFHVFEYGDGTYYIYATMTDDSGKQVGYTKRIFNAETGELRSPPS